MTKYVIFRPDGTASGPFADTDGHDGTIVEVPDDFSWRTFKSDFTTLTVAPTLDRIKAAKWAEIKAEREARRIVAVTSYGVFDCDETGKSNMLGQQQAIDLLGVGVAEPITWKMHDNSFVELTRAEFTDACLQVLASIQAVYATSFALEAAIDAAETLADIEAITWPA